MMKKSLVTCIYCLLTLVAFAQKDFNIHIATPNYANGTKLFITIMDNDRRKVLKRDSAIINNQSAKFSGKIAQPSNYINFIVRFNKNYSMTMMVVDTGRNEFILKTLPQVGVTNSSLMIKAINSKSNDIKYALDSIERLYYNKFGKNESTGITTLDKKSQLVLNHNQIDYLKKYPKDYISLICLYEISNHHRGSTYTNTVLAALNSFDVNLKNSSFGKKFYQEKITYLNSLKSAKIGGQVPKFKVKDFSGKLFDNESLKGQNYVIVFSATWCVPCQKSLPEIISLYEKYKAKGLKVVYFNEDDNITKWAEHIKKNKLNWINVSERVKPNESKIAREFDVYSVPSYFIVDRNGIIVHNSVETSSDINELAKSLSALYNSK